MPYRDDRDALRERIEQLAQEIDRAREERDRVPALERELADARARLARIDRPPAGRAARRVRVLLFVLAGALTSVGTVLLLAGRGAAVAPSPPPVLTWDPESMEPPRRLDVESPPGWASTTTSDGRWTHLTSPDGKARLLFSHHIGVAGAGPALHEAWNRLCPSAPWVQAMPREIGPDRLPALYHEAPCTGEGATVVALDVEAPPAVARAPAVVSTSEARSAKNHLVLAWRLESDCPESRRLELASMIASIRRRR